MKTPTKNVIFGTGPLGLAVARRLLADGKTVRVVNRSGKATVPDGAELVAADATDPSSAARVCDGAAVVFHCGNARYSKWLELLPPLMNGIIGGAAAAHAKLVYGDNLYLYGRVDGPIREDLPVRPISSTGRARAQVFEMLMQAHSSGRVRATIGRASDFYGPYARVSTIGDIIFGRAVSGKPAQVLGNPDLPHTHTYIDDFAAGLVTLAEHDEALGQVWHVPSAETITTRRFIDMVFRQIGQPPRIQRPPMLVISLLALFNPDLRAVKENLYQSQEPWIVDHSKFARAFGARTTPHEQAIEATLAWFKQGATLSSVRA